MKDSSNKSNRVLDIYTKLIAGKIVNKRKEAKNHGVDERSIQRDIEEIKCFLDEDTSATGYKNKVVYDRGKKGYKLEHIYNTKLTNPEILSICKIILESRAFIKEEMQEILNKLITSCVPQENRKIVQELINNEVFHYIQPRHGVSFMENLWTVGQAIRKKKMIKIDYFRLKDKSVVTRNVKPLAIMFSEYYFYLIAIIDDEKVRENFDIVNDSFPTIYRIDRIKSIEVLDENINISYADRFQEGEFRKRVQFMYGGKLQKIKFKYFGADIDAILDRLPTAQIISEEESIYTVQAEVFGKGIDMWIRSQGDMIEMM
ncbi:WYL domain protein [Peptostreptococcaceae bacterium AS15]|nr:WYL domain protein [Peptostreptococcaceae bacterium AS15]